MKLIKITKNEKFIMHGTATTDDTNCEHEVHDSQDMKIGEAIATEVRKLKKGEEYQIEINGKIGGKILTRRK